MSKRPEDGREHQQEDPDFTEAKRMAGELGLFVKRSATSGGRIDSGWMPTGAGIDEHGRRVITVGKTVEREPGKREVAARSIFVENVARLNYGRARLALEHLFSERAERERVKNSTADLDDAIDLIDKAEPGPNQEENPDAEARLRLYFEQEARRRWHALFPKTKAKKLKELRVEILNNREQVTAHFQEDIDQLNPRLLPLQAERTDSHDPQRIRELEEEIEEGVEVIKRLTSEKRRTEQAIDKIADYVNLAEQYG